MYDMSVYTQETNTPSAEVFCVREFSTFNLIQSSLKFFQRPNSYMQANAHQKFYVPHFVMNIIIIQIFPVMIIAKTNRNECRIFKVSANQK